MPPPPSESWTSPPYGGYGARIRSSSSAHKMLSSTLWPLCVLLQAVKSMLCCPSLSLCFFLLTVLSSAHSLCYWVYRMLSSVECARFCSSGRSPPGGGIWVDLLLTVVF